MAKQFVLTVRENTLLGAMFVPFFITKGDDKEYYKVVENIIEDDLNKNPNDFDYNQAKIVRTINQYSDKNIIKTFSKNNKISVAEFFSKIEDDTIEEKIKPFIERRNVEIIDLAKKNNIKIFYKVDRYENIYFNDEIIIENSEAEAVFNFERTKEETKYFLSVLHNSTEINLTNKIGIILSNNPCRIILNNSLFFFKDIDAKKLQPFFTKDYVSILKRMEKKYYETFVLNSIKKFKVKHSGFTIKKLRSQKKAILSIESDWKNEYTLILKYSYDNITFLANSKNFLIVKFKEEKDDFVYDVLERDIKWENEIKDFLSKLNLNIENEVNYKVKFNSISAEYRNYETITWLNNHSQKIQQKGIEIQQKFSDKNYYIGKTSFELKLLDKKDWFDIYGDIYFGEYRYSFLELMKILKSNSRTFELPNGEIAIIPEEWFAKYQQVAIMGEEKENEFRLKKYHYSLLENTDLEPNIEINTKNLFKDFSEIEKLAKKIPEEITAELRSYQQIGFAWLLALQNNKFGGCLADDMGLGKTLQTITLLTKNKSDFQKKDKEFLALIVVPKSLVHNWINEFKKFSPQTEVLNYSVSNRKELENEIYNYDIVVTSYGVLRNDIDFLSFVNFNYIVLDESQYIKNPDSKIYKAVLKLGSDNKIVLTGTPIENSLSDLWAQMNFVNEGILGSKTFFKQYFIDEIEKNKNEAIQEQLKKIISPFILRRTKSEVAKDLPELIEQIIYCEMSDEQRKIYEEEKSKIRNKIIELIEEDKVKNTSIWLLRAMLQLRQISNHPKMIGIEGIESGKFNEIIPRIETLISEKHKVLIFSSFVKHLKIFEEYLKKEEIGYSFLTGASTKREKIIQEFQEDKNKNVFLISIKAGGVGLNLTSADYVFILDPWWNPAIENQAISRAHRIGQKKNVNVYRFISLDTIEEKIRKLQEEKNELAEIFVNNNNPLKSLNNDSILNIFE